MVGDSLKEITLKLTKGSFRLRKNGDYLFIPNVKQAVKDKAKEMKAYVVGDGLKEITLKMDELTDDERTIILKGCLINYYRDSSEE